MIQPVYLCQNKSNQQNPAYRQLGIHISFSVCNLFHLVFHCSTHQQLISQTPDLLLRLTSCNVFHTCFSLKNLGNLGQTHFLFAFKLNENPQMFCFYFYALPIVGLCSYKKKNKNPHTPNVSPELAVA